MPCNTYIIIPNEIVHAKISSDAKLLYGIITSFTANGKPCFAGNRKLNEMMGGTKTERSIRNYLQELKDLKFLDISGKAHKRRLTALKVIPPRQKNATKRSQANTTNSTSLADNDLSFVPEDTRYQFQNFIEHCLELGKPITQRMAKALYQSLQRHASDAFFNNRSGQTMVMLRHEIISRAITGGYKNFAPLYRTKMKKEENNNMPNSNRKTNSEETDKSAMKRTGVKGGTRLADALQNFKVNIE
jgi:hypothetical protein